MVEKLTAIDDKSNILVIIELLFLAKLSHFLLVCLTSSKLLET